MDNQLKEFYLKSAFINRLNTQNAELLISMKNDLGEVISGDNELAEFLYAKMKVLYMDEGERDIKDYDPAKVIPFEAEELEMALLKLSNGKALASDLMPDKALKMIVQLEEKERKEILIILTELFNNFLRSDNTPKLISIGRMIFLNKVPGIIGDFDSVRPICILSPLMKLIELVILLRLQNEVEMKGIIHWNQKGFTNNCNTNMNLMLLNEVVENDRKNLKRGLRLAFFDFKKAYDSVRHTLLLDKLRHCNIHPSNINLVAFLLNNYSVSILDKKIIRINSGLPQGSGVSPILFNIFINDFVVKLSEFNELVPTFADDLCTVASSDELVKRTIDSVYEWGGKNMISLNPRKSTIITIGSNKKQLKNYRNIEVRDSYKYLGITVSLTFSFSSHISSLERYIENFSLRVKTLKDKEISIATKLTLWKAILKSKAMYGIESFSWKASDFKRLERVINVSMKKALGVNKLASNERLLGITETLSPIEAATIAQVGTVKKFLKVHEESDLIRFLVEQTRKRVEEIKLGDDWEINDFNSWKHNAKEVLTRRRIKDIFRSEDIKMGFSKELFCLPSPSCKSLLKTILNLGPFSPYVYKKCFFCSETNSTITFYMNARTLKTREPS